MRLLIVSYLFSPASVIGAIRWTKLAKYLSLEGYEIDVISTSAKVPEDKLLERDIDGRIKVIRIDHKNPSYNRTVYYKDQQTALASKNSNGKKSLSRRIKDAIWSCKMLKYPASLYVARQDYGRSRDFARQAQDYISKNIDMSRYDAVICTYGPTGGTLMGIWFKKNYPNIPLIMDFRDPMTNFRNPWPYNGIYGRLQRKVCKRSDKIIAVTDDLIGRICGKNTEKCVEIPNGYDLNDFASTEKKEAAEGKYTIVYTGSIYAGYADFSPLFRALGELSDSGRIDKNDIVIKYIGSSGAELERQAAEHGMKELVINSGRLPRSETLAYQKGARQLLLTIWNNKVDGGYRPGKILEYMVAGNPVIALISGDAPNSVLRRTVESAHIGVAYENACAQEDYPTLRERLAEDYARWKQGLAPIYEPDSEYIAGFSYPKLAERVSAVIRETAGEKNAV